MGFLAKVPGEVFSAGGGVVGSILQSRAAGKAADTQAKSAAAALAFERENEARRRQEYDQEQRMKAEQWEADQRRLSPYRLAAASVLAKYGIQIPMEDAAPTPDLSATMEAPPDLSQAGIMAMQPGEGGVPPMPPGPPPPPPPPANLGDLGQYGRGVYGR